MAPNGRPTKYKPEYCQEIIDYFSGAAYSENDEGRLKVNDLPLFESFAHSLGVCRDTLHEWRRKHSEFSDAYKKAKELQKRNWIDASLRGLYNPAFTIFMGKNVFGWSDKQDIKHIGGLDLNVNVNFVKSDKKDDDS